MAIGTLVLIIVVLLLLGAAPSWPYSEWGYGSSGVLGLALMIVIALLIIGRI